MNKQAKWKHTLLWWR